MLKNIIRFKKVCLLRLLTDIGLAKHKDFNILKDIMGNLYTKYKIKKAITWLIVVVVVISLSIGGFLAFQKIIKEGEKEPAKEGEATTQTADAEEERDDSQESAELSASEKAILSGSNQPSQQLANKVEIIARLTAPELGFECTQQGATAPTLVLDHLEALFPADERSTALQEGLDKIATTHSQLIVFKCQSNAVELIVLTYASSAADPSYNDLRNYVSFAWAASAHPDSSECQQEFWEAWFANGLIMYEAHIQTDAAVRSSHVKTLREVNDALGGQLNNKCP